MRSRRRRETLLSMATLAFASASFAHQPPTPAPPDLTADVLDLFRAHCAECHGPQVRRPKGKFGLILDPPAMVAEGYLVPGNLNDSMVYQLLVAPDARYRMPPKSAQGGPLSQAQIDLVKAWIEAGAGAPAAAPSPSQGAPPDAPVNADPAPDHPPDAAAPGESPAPTTAPQRSTADRALAFTGKFHPVVVHFPIALLVVAALAELLVMARRTWARDAARLLVPLGAAAAVVAAGLGLVSASTQGYATALVSIHQWLGIAAASGALLAAILQQFSFRRPGATGPALAYRLLLFASAGAVGAAGHFGGLIVFGEDHFAF